MTRNEARDLIALRLGNRTDLNASIVSEMQLAQTELEQNKITGKLHFLLSEESETACVGDSADNRIQVPSDMTHEYEYGDLVLIDSDGDEVFLEKKEWDDLRQAYVDEDAGTPAYYALVGDYFRLYPIPDSNYTVKMVYYKQATVLTTDIENAWLANAPELLIAATGRRMTQYLQNQLAFGMFQQQYIEALDGALKTNTMRAMSNAELCMGGG
jgi:hypothetical protein